MSLTILYVVLALGTGFAAGFFFYRLRHSRDLGLFEARELALSNRASEFDRLQSSVRPAEPADDRQVSILESTIERLREDLEERSMALDFLKEEHRLEQKVLRHEIESLKAGKGRRSDFRYEIEDVQFATSPDGFDEDPGTLRDEQPVGKAPEETESGQQVDTDTGSGVHATTDPEARPQHQSDEPASLNRPAKPRTATDWAGDVVSYLFGDLFAAYSDQRDGPSESVPPETRSEPDAEPVADETSSTGTYPKFRTLHELQLFGDASPAAAGLNGQNGSAPNAEMAGLRLLLGLSVDDFDTLTEMGYASYEGIAQLSDSEIDLLSSRFGVPASRIISIWISGAQLRLHQGV